MAGTVPNYSGLHSQEMPAFTGGAHAAGSALSAMAYVLLTIQMSSSTLAGVYTEYLLKDYKHLSVNIQNIFMYIASAVVNIFVAAVFGSGGGKERIARGSPSL